MAGVIRVGRPSSVYLKLIVSLAVLFSLYFFVEADQAIAAIRAIGGPSLLACLALLVVSQQLSSYRFHRLLLDAGFDVTALEAHRANIFGLLGGLLFFNIFGQGVTRSVLLERHRVPGSTVFFLTLLERATAMLVLLAGALVGAGVLYGKVPTVFGDGSSDLARVAAYGASALVLVLALGVTRRQRAQLVLFLKEISSFSILRILLATLLMHASMLACYVIVAINVAPAMKLGLSVSASIIVMLAAALPISFAGWGFRELSASLAYAQAGATAEQGLVTGAVIGVLSIVALVGNAAWLQWRSADEPRPTAQPGPTAGVVSTALERPSYWLIGLGTAFLVYFNVRIPTNSGELTVNLGDPLAIIGAIVLALVMFQARSVSVFWRNRQLMIALAAVSLVLAAGLIHGYAVYGRIDWAIYNRFLGWFLLLAYAGCGALLVAVSGKLGFEAICRVVVAAGVGLSLMEFAMVLLAGFGILPIHGGYARAEGMAGNANAFAFQLQTALIALIAGNWFRKSDAGVWPILSAAALLLGLWMAGSRASFGALALTIPFVLTMAYRRGALAGGLKKLGLAAVVALAFAFCLPQFWSFGLPISVGSVPGFLVNGSTSIVTGPEAERFESILGGLSLWLEHPVFGAGLGAYIHEHLLQTGVPLVVHNSLAWVAGELGAVGIVAYGYLLFAIIAPVLAMPARERDTPQYVLAGVLVAFAIVSLAHDILYQRLLWLVIGASAALPCVLRQALGAVDKLRPDAAYAVGGDDDRLVASAVPAAAPCLEHQHRP